MDKNEDVVQLLKTYNQEHIVKLLNKLEGRQKEELIEQIKNKEYNQIFSIIDKYDDNGKNFVKL